MIKIPRGKPDKPLEILWDDATSNSDWRKTERGKTLTITTVGYLENESDHQVTVVRNMAEENKNVSCSMTIPRSCIKSMKRFRRKQHGR